MTVRAPTGSVSRCRLGCRFLTLRSGPQGLPLVVAALQRAPGPFPRSARQTLKVKGKDGPVPAAQTFPPFKPLGP